MNKSCTFFFGQLNKKLYKNASYVKSGANFFLIRKKIDPPTNKFKDRKLRQIRIYEITNYVKLGSVTDRQMSCALFNGVRCTVHNLSELCIKS